MFSRHLAAGLVFATCLGSGCALLEPQFPPPGGPPLDSHLLEAIESGSNYSLADLCEKPVNFTARTDRIAVRGWERRLRRLGLPCVIDKNGRTLRSKTPDGFPFAVWVSGWPFQPGEPAYQFRASIEWENRADAERGRLSLQALEQAKPGKAD